MTQPSSFRGTALRIYFYQGVPMTLMSSQVWEMRLGLRQVPVLMSWTPRAPAFVLIKSWDLPAFSPP